MRQADAAAEITILLGRPKKTIFFPLMLSCEASQRCSGMFGSSLHECWEVWRYVSYEAKVPLSVEVFLLIPTRPLLL